MKNWTKGALESKMRRNLREYDRVAAGNESEENEMVLMSLTKQYNEYAAVYESLNGDIEDFETRLLAELAAKNQKASKSGIEAKTRINAA